MCSKNAFFIVIDGIDGAGKSTQIKLLKDALNDRGHEIYLTREPGGTQLGDDIRNILLNRDNDMSPYCEMLLFCADRVENQRLVKWKLSKNINVLSDRFLPSAYAYQVFARGLDLSFLDSIVKKTVHTMPDLTIILDLEPHESLRRANVRLFKEGKRAVEGRFEDEDINFFEKVRDGFKWYVEQDHFGASSIIDASGSVEDVSDRIFETVEKYIKNL